MISIAVLALEFCFKAFLKGANLSVSNEAVDIICIAVFSVAFAMDLSRSKKFKLYSVPLFLGFLFRVFLVFWDIYGRSIFVLPNSGADSEMFYRQSVLYMYTGDTKRGLFPKVMGTIFMAIGPSRIFSQFIITLYSVVSLIILVLLLEKCKISDNNKKVICMVVSLLPNLAILSSIYLRESIVAMFITVSFYFFFKWFNGERNISFIIAFICAFIASAFHSGTAAIAAGYVAILLLYDRKNKEFKMRAKNIVPVLIMVFVIAFLFNNYGNELFGKMQKVEDISDVANDSGQGGSSYAQYVGNSNNPLNMIIFTIPRMLFFIASPMPFQWRGISDIIAFCFSSLFFLCTVWFTIKFFRSGEQKNRTLVIALSIVLICTFFVFGWGVQNAGTACRHRDKITVICGLLLALTYIPRSPSQTKEEVS